MMKKWALLFLLTPKLFALYMGNPSAPEIIDEGFFFCKENWFAVKGGYQRDWVFNRNMKGVSTVSGRMDRFDLIADQGVLTINLIDRIEFYGSAGAVRLHAAHRPSSLMRYEYETDNQCLWGLGGRGTLASWKGASFGIHGAYQRGSSSMKWMTLNGAPISGGSNGKITYSEWQVGLAVSYPLSFFIPYLGAKYSNATARFKHLPPGFFSSVSDFKTKNRRKFGMAIGTTFSNGDRFGATLEARLIDEESITLAAEVKF